MLYPCKLVEIGQVVPEIFLTPIPMQNANTTATGQTICLPYLLIFKYVNIKLTFTSAILVVPEPSYTGVTLVTSDTRLTGTATCVNITLGIGGGGSTVTVSTTSTAVKAKGVRLKKITNELWCVITNTAKF